MSHDRRHVRRDTETHTDGAGAMIVELRSTGPHTLVSPSAHPSGEEYDRLDVEPATVPAPMLAACVKALADAVIVRREGSVIADKPASPPLSPTDASDVETRAIAYLAAMPPAVSGSGGHSQTYAAATALVHGFGIDPDRALARVIGSGDTSKYEYDSTFSKVRNASGTLLPYTRNQLRAHCVG